MSLDERAAKHDDCDGNRVKATVGGVTTRYVGDYYEYEVGTATVRKYYTHWGKRIALREGGTLYWLLTDHLGSTAIVTGTTASEVRYDAWGADRYTSGSVHTTYRFTGERWESGIKLYRMGARWYDPEIGRWVSADTIVPEPGSPQLLNRYSFVSNNPLRYTDPTGHQPCDGECPKKLTPQQLDIVQRMAEGFGIPPELLATVLNTERVYDTEWYDLFQNWYQQGLVGIAQAGAFPAIRLNALAQMIVWEALWKPGAEGVGPGLGLGHVHTGPAREVEGYFRQRGLESLVSASDSITERWKTLLSDEGNVRYVAASLRRLVEIRQGGEQEYGKIASIQSLSASDIRIIMDGYWWGVATRYGSGGYTRLEFHIATQPKHSNGLLVDCSYGYYRQHFFGGG